MIYKFDSKEAKKKYVEEVKEYSDIRFRVDDPIPDKKDVNKDYIKLGYKITDRIGWINGASSEYYGLSHMLTPEQAKIGLKLKKMKRFTVDDLLKKLPQYTRESLDEQLFDMSCRGFLEYGYNDKGERLYVVPPVIVGMGEWGALHSYLDNPVSNAIKHKTMVNFFDRNGYIPIGQLGSMIAPGNSGIGMHVVPVEKEVNASNISVPVEHLSYHLDRVDKYAAMPCVCRVTHTILDNNGSVDDPDDWCLGLGTFADYLAETGKGHLITREKAEEIIQRAEDNGFVHQITAQEGGDGAYIICNCDKNACLAIRSSQLFNTPNMSRSSYTAKVNQDNCVACGGCVEVCPAGAVKLGQRLKYKDGSSPEFPVSDCVDNHIIWDKSKWDIYWRDTHRTNCYDMGTAPCKTACPAHIAVEGYVKLARQGRYAEALELIKKENPFPAVCGRVCNKRCEDACTRGLFDEPIAIDDIKKYVSELDLGEETRCVPEKLIAANNDKFSKRKIAIIGAGPAGLSCAFYLAKAGYKPTVFEKNDLPGGMMQYGIPSYKLQKDVVQAEVEVIRLLGAEIKCGVEVGKDVTLKQLREEGYEAFYIAIGCQGARQAGIPGEDANGIDYAVSFLKKAADDLTQKMDDEVVVVGGGNVAVDVARTAKRFGASKVTMISLESREEMPAKKDEISETLGDDIFIQNSWGPKEVLKDEKGNVKGVLFKKCLRTIDPATGKFSPEYDEEDTMTISCTKVIFAIGQAIDWGTMLEGEAMEYVHGNYPKADARSFQTSVPDIFVGGDVYHGPRFLIDAIAEGKEGSESIQRFLLTNDLTLGRDPHDLFEFDKENVALPYNYDMSGRQSPAPKSEYKMDFEDHSGTLDEGQVRIEASRCLQCGASYVDPSRCIGWGICTTRCMFDAIHLVRDHPEHSNVTPYKTRFLTAGTHEVKKVARITKNKVVSTVDNIWKK